MPSCKRLAVFRMHSRTKASYDSVFALRGLTHHEMLQSLRSKITAAAREAEEEDKDQSTLSAPLERVEKAISELHRASAQLPRSRALPEWNEDAFMTKIARLEKIVARLRDS